MSVDTGVSVVDVLAARSPLNPLVPRVPRLSIQHTAPVSGPASLRALAPEPAPEGAAKTARPQLRRDSGGAGGAGQFAATRERVQAGGGAAPLTSPGGLHPRRPTEATGRGRKRPSAAQRRRHVISASQVATAKDSGGQGGDEVGPDTDRSGGDDEGVSHGNGLVETATADTGEGSLPRLAAAQQPGPGSTVEPPSHADEDRLELSLLAQRTRARRQALASHRQRMDGQEPTPVPRSPAPTANERCRVLAHALGSERAAPTVRCVRALAVAAMSDLRLSPPHLL